MATLSAQYPAIGELRRRIELRRPLAPLTTLKIGGAAERYFQPRSPGEVAAAVKLAAGSDWPLWVIGGGSNLLVPDEGVPGLVVDLGLLNEVVVEGNVVRAGAGARLSRVIATACRAGLAGLEGLAAIPGVVGGAAAMNAGGKYGEFGDSCESVTVVRADGAMCRLNRGEVGFGYRGTNLSGALVTGVTLRLAPGDADTLMRTSAEIAKAKRKGQPYDLPSAGCTFRNPATGPSAGTLIDRAGLKGERCGGAQVSTLHANFIVNTGGAKASDVLALAETVRRRVHGVHGVELAYEIRRWTPSSTCHTREWSVPGPQ